MPRKKSKDEGEVELVVTAPPEIREVPTEVPTKKRRRKKYNHDKPDDVEMEVSAIGESRERVNFRVPRELWNDIKRQEIVEKDLAKNENWSAEPTKTDVLVMLLRTGLKARQVILSERAGKGNEKAETEYIRDRKDSA